MEQVNQNWKPGNFSVTPQVPPSGRKTRIRSKKKREWKKKPRNQTQMEQVNQNLEAEWQEIFEEDFVVTPTTPQTPQKQEGTQVQEAEWQENQNQVEEEAQNQTQMEQVDQNLEASGRKTRIRSVEKESGRRSPEGKTQMEQVNQESGSRVAGKPESEVKRKSGRRSPEPNTDGAGEPESGSRVAGKF